jgi:hypothetical protein
MDSLSGSGEHQYVINFINQARPRSETLEDHVRNALYLHPGTEIVPDHILDYKRNVLMCNNGLCNAYGYDPLAHTLYTPPIPAPVYEPPPVLPTEPYDATEMYGTVKTGSKMKTKKVKPPKVVTIGDYRGREITKESVRDMVVLRLDFYSKLKSLNSVDQIKLSRLTKEWFLLSRDDLDELQSRKELRLGRGINPFVSDSIQMKNVRFVEGTRSDGTAESVFRASKTQPPRWLLENFEEDKKIDLISKLQQLKLKLSDDRSEDDSSSDDDDNTHIGGTFQIDRTGNNVMTVLTNFDHRQGIHALTPFNLNATRMKRPQYNMENYHELSEFLLDDRKDMTVFQSFMYDSNDRLGGLNTFIKEESYTRDVGSMTALLRSNVGTQAGICFTRGLPRLNANGTIIQGDIKMILACAFEWHDLRELFQKWMSWFVVRIIHDTQETISSYLKKNPNDSNPAKLKKLTHLKNSAFAMLQTCFIQLELQEDQIQYTKQWETLGFVEQSYGSYKLDAYQWLIAFAERSDTASDALAWMKQKISVDIKNTTFGKRNNIGDRENNIDYNKYKIAQGKSEYVENLSAKIHDSLKENLGENTDLPDIALTQIMEMLDPDSDFRGKWDVNPKYTTDQTYRSGVRKRLEEKEEKEDQSKRTRTGGKMTKKR